MNVEAIIADLTQRGIRLIPDPPKLGVEPASKLTDADRKAIRAHKSELLTVLANRQQPRIVTPNSRHPLIEPTVRAKIESIEAEARAKGWPAELLWSYAYWDLPRGLAAVLDADDEIVGVTADVIEIVRMRCDVMRFRRNNA
jgi:hypothetical protein